MRLLGIETSCDETAAAVVEDGRNILSNVVASQVELHKKFGGVVPEIACRAHMEVILPVIEEALSKAQTPISQIDGFAVANLPGLIGALLVGTQVAKSLSWLLKKPLVGVNHLHAHIFANFLAHRAIEFPFVALVASGGHTSLFHCREFDRFDLIGATTDDAAGEAFDKVAGILGLGYPGGPEIEKWARNGNPQSIRFPRSLLGPSSLDFSFSGLKTAVLYYVHGQNARRVSESVRLSDRRISDIAASFQEAVVDVLVEKTLAAARKKKTPRIVLGGGVACNGRLRQRLSERASSEGKICFYPPAELCTDNAAMVAGLAYYRLRAGEVGGLDLEAVARMQ